MAFNTIFTQRDNIAKREVGELAMSGKAIKQFMPLSFRLSDGNWWLFPIEPLISVSGKNIIVRRNVAKSQKRGTVKERWAEDDFTITIQGTFVDADLHTYPDDKLRELYDAITQRKPIEVTNSLFVTLGINRIVVESFDFPFSKGENVQNFSLTAYSDDITDLFIEVNNV